MAELTFDIVDQTLIFDTGAPGAQGPAGAAGQGVPANGTTRQILAKASDTDYDTQWINGLPVINLNDLEGADFNAKWTAALAIVADMGGGDIIIPENASITTALDTITASHSNIRVRGAHKGVTLTGTGVAQVLRVNGAANVLVEGFRVSMGASTGYGILSVGDAVTIQNMEIFGTGTTFSGYAISATGSKLCLGEKCYIHDCRQAIRVAASTSVETKSIRIGRVCVEDVGDGSGGRAINITGVSSGQAMRDIHVANPVLDGLPYNCQPIRVDGALSGISSVHVTNAHITQAPTTDKADDAISFNKVTNFHVTDCDVDRYCDIAINASNGCEDGVITDNRCRDQNWPISIGATDDRTNGLVNKNVLIKSNRINDFRIAAIAMYSADDCSIYMNRGQITANAAALGGAVTRAYGFDYQNSLRIGYSNNDIRGYETSELHNSDTGLVSSFKYRDADSPQTLKKVSTTVRNNTATLAADPDLQFYADADAIYMLDLKLLFEATGTADFRRSWTVPAGASIDYWIDTTTFSGQSVFNGASAFNMSGAGAMEAHREYARLVMGATAGVVSFNWCQQTAEASDASVFSGSSLEVQRIA